MLRTAFALLLLFTGCGVEPQPDSARTVAAFEVPLRTPEERAEFLTLLRQSAAAEGLHVDASGPKDLARLSAVSPMTIHAGVWRGSNDDEILASVMDLPGNSSRPWITFSRGEDSDLARRFRERAMRAILDRWPATQSLPIMPTGAIPLPQDLRQTQNGYRVAPEAAARYGLASTSSLVAPA